MLRHDVGTSSSAVQKGWTLTDGTDTVRNATRLRWTLDMAYANPDSVDQAMPDSIVSERISEMRVDVRTILSERLLTERSLWFSDDARYPVLTDSRVSRILLDEAGAPTDTVPVSLLAMHYPRDFQHSDTGEEFQTVRPSERVDGNGSVSYGDKDTGSKALTIVETTVSGNTVNVILSSPSGPVTATMALFSDSGIRLTAPVEVSVGTIPQSCSLEAPGSWSDVLLLRVDAGDESYTEKIIK